VVGRALAEAGTTPKYRPGLGESAEDLWSGFSTAPERTWLEGSVHRDHDAQPIGQCLVRVTGRPRQPLRPEANAPCRLPPLLLCLTCLAPSLDVRWRPLESVAVVSLSLRLGDDHVQRFPACRLVA
jgi:hypothetical protein